MLHPKSVKEVSMPAPDRGMYQPFPATATYDIICCMSIRSSSRISSGQVRPSEREQTIQILSLEYQTLRSELLTLTSGRFQFLGLLAAAAAILASGLSQTLSRGDRWFLGGLALITVLGGLAYYWLLGTMMITISRRIAAIEQRINEVAYSRVDLLSWESTHQQRSRWTRLTIGPPPPRMFDRYQNHSGGHQHP